MPKLNYSYRPIEETWKNPILFALLQSLHSLCTGAMVQVSSTAVLCSHEGEARGNT